MCGSRREISKICDNPTIAIPPDTAAPPGDVNEWRPKYGATPERDASFTTLSGEPIQPLYTENEVLRTMRPIDRFWTLRIFCP